MYICLYLRASESDDTTAATGGVTSVLYCH